MVLERGMNLLVTCRGQALAQQGLSGGEVASVLGISRNHAHALLSRARDQLETSLGVLAVARTGLEKMRAVVRSGLEASP